MKKENQSLFGYICLRIIVFNGNRRRNYKIDQFGLSMTDNWLRTNFSAFIEAKWQEAFDEYKGSLNIKKSTYTTTFNSLIINLYIF
jgi:hypothetical protein